MDKTLRIDGLIWYLYGTQKRFVQPICPTHKLRVYPFGQPAHYSHLATFLKCADCTELHKIPRPYDEEQRYVIDRIDAINFKKLEVINLDDESVPFAKEKISTKDDKYFITSLLTSAKSGIRLIIYAGEKGKVKKTQIFVEPNVKKLAFDPKDLHPNDVFAKVEVTFDDRSKSEIKKA